jgi:probable HAF family extracellular repeat protein
MSSAQALSAGGHVAGGSRLSDDRSSHAVLWQNGGRRDLGTLGGTWSSARGVNTSGQVVGSSNLANPQVYRAFLWENGAMRDLGTLGGSNSTAQAINAWGQVAGASMLAGDPEWQPAGYAPQTFPIYHAFLFDGTGMRDLGTLGGTGSYAYGINDAGHVVGDSFTAGDDVSHAFLYDGATMRDLGTLGGNWGGAYAINSAGLIVGWSTMAEDAPSHAFISDGTTMRDLGTLGGTRSSASAINNLGHVVGNSYLAGDVVWRPFLYRDGSMKDLTRLIRPDSGWDLQWVYAINDAGQIVGSGTYQGQTRAFLLQPTPPDAPFYLTATIVPGPAVRLDWTDTSDRETAFAIWRKSASGDFVRVGVVGPNVASFLDRGLQPDAPYTYRVRAILHDVASAWSNEAAAVTPPLPPAPLSLAMIGRTAHTIQVGWRDTGSDETAFAIWRKSGAGDWVRVGVVGPNVTSYTDQGLNPLTSHTYRVRTINLSGASAWSNLMTGTTLPLPPSPPTRLQAKGLSRSQIQLSWVDTSTNETGFAIARKTASSDWVWVTSVGPNVTTFTDATNLLPDTTYTYRVRSHNTGGSSAWSNESITFTPGYIPPAATNLSARVKPPNGIVLGWQNNSHEITGIVIWRKTGSGEFTRIAVMAPFWNVYTDATITPGATYTYRLRSIYGAVGSNWSNEATVTVPPAP